MKKFYYIIILILFTLDILFCDNLSKYSLQKVKEIPAGEKEGLIGWESKVAGGFSGPTCFAISKKNIFYIPDRVNYRINVYDENFNYIKTIVEEKKESHFALSMKIDSNDNLISLLVGKGLKKINQNGTTLFFIKWKDLPNNRGNRYNFFPLNEEVFLYNNKDEIELINNIGEIEKQEIVKTNLEQLSNEQSIQNNLSKGLVVPNEKKQVMDSLRNDNKYILVDDKLYNSNFNKTRIYFDQIKVVQEYVKSEKVSRGIGPIKEINIDLDKYNMHLIGYDDEHNSYWRGIKDKVKHTKDLAVIVFSKYGELLDAFNYGQYFHNEPNTELYKTTESVIAVAPSGDVYFLVGSKEKYTMYKVERQW